jgi:WD40 repeat protein
MLAAVVLTAVVAFGVVAWQWRVADQARIEAEAIGAERLIALAQSHWLLDDLPAARRFLADCPPKYRTPDWHHLRWLCHAEIASHHDPDVRGEVVFAPDGTGLLWNSKRSVKFWSGSGDPVTVCEAPGDLLGPPAVNDEGDRVTFVSAGKPVLLGAFGEPDEPLFQRVVSVCDRKYGRCLTQWTCEASQDHALLQPLSPDGRLVFVPRKESWTIRDAGSGRVLRAFPAPLPTALAFGRRSQLLAYSSEKVPGITVWDDLAADRAAHHVSHPESVGRITFSPDGRRLAYLAARREASGAARWIHVWDLARRQEITAWSVPHAYAMAFSPNGRFLAYADQDKVIRIRNLDADRDAAALRGHANSFIRLSCSPDGTRLVSVAPGGSIKVWDLQPLAEPDARP